MSIIRFSFCILLVAFIWIVGCTTQTADPIAGWHKIGLDPNSVDKPIQDDYRGFIQGLPANQQGGYVGEIWFFEDGTGQHAVSIQIFADNKPALWYYAIIYDKYDKRTKVIKYGGGKYQS